MHGNRNNLINLAEIDQDQARLIRSLGGKARQEQRRKELALKRNINLMCSYYDELEELNELISKAVPIKLTQKERADLVNDYLGFLINTKVLTEKQRDLIDLSNFLNQ